MMENLDRLSYVPVYLQIQRQLRNDLAHRWESGDRFLSDQEVVAQFRVSRMTARQAIAGLVQEGLLERRKGVGTYVRERHVLSHDLSSPVESSEQWVAQKARVVRKVVHFKVEDCPFEDAVQLNLHHDDQVLHFVRQRFVDGRPVAVDNRYVPLSIGRLLEPRMLEQGTLTHLLPERFGIQIGDFTRIFEGAGADGQVAEWLEVTVGTPVLKVGIVIRSQSHDPLLVGTSHYRAGEVRFTHKV